MFNYYYGIFGLSRTIAEYFFTLGNLLHNIALIIITRLIIILFMVYAQVEDKLEKRFGYLLAMIMQHPIYGVTNLARILF